MAQRRIQLVWLVAALLLVCSARARAEEEKVNTIREAIAKIGSCWKPPPLARANPIDITVIVSFNRAGEILGHPYRVAVMEALQRCSPMPFTDSMAGAVAGRPFAIQFHNRKPPPPQPTEKRAWLTPKIL